MFTKICFPMQTRTRRQREVLDFIRRYVERHGYEPSYQLIARHLGLSSKAGIAKHVKALEEQGYLIRRNGGRGFSLPIPSMERLSSSGTNIRWLEVPDDGNTPEHWPGDGFTLPEFMLNSHTSGEILAFRVPDDSMSGRNICEGDIALIEERSFVRDGDLAVAVIKKTSAVLRTFYRDGQYFEMRSSEESGTTRLSADKMKICGIFRGLLRPAK